MAYLGFCSKFGLKGAVAIHALAPAIPALGFGLVESFTGASSPEIRHEVLKGMVIGQLGAVMASNVSMFVKSRFGFDRQEVGVSRGSALLQKWQAAAYASTLALGIGANAMFELPRPAPIQDISTTIQADVKSNRPVALTYSSAQVN